MSGTPPPPVAGDAPGAEDVAAPLRLHALVAYFLRLGTTGFGGPIALAAAMQRDLVVERRWISEQDYLQGLALAQLAPGPLAAQLAIYLGWVRGRVLGATLVAVAFILPSFLMVIALSAAYLRLGGLSWMQGAFHGVAPAAIAIIARGAAKLVKMSLRSDRLLWAVFVANATVTALTGREVVWVFLSSGLAVMIARSPRLFMRSWGLPGVTPAAAWLVTGLHGPATPSTLLGIGTFFAAAGSLVFGSGLAIVPFLHGGVVDGHHWLTDRQFLDAVAVAMITPGPVVITVAFIGYLVAGLAGAGVAAGGVFLPCYMLVIVPAPYFHRIAQSGPLRSFVSGVTAAATGAIAGAVLVLGRRAIVDWPSAGIGVVALALVFGVRRIPEPIVVLLAALAGLAFAR